ncbi:hypothetical protein D3C80_1210380 [compost metagenome]
MAPPTGNFIERAGAGDIVWRQVLGQQRATAGTVDPGIGGNAVQVLVTEQALSQSGEHDHPGAEGIGSGQQVALDPAVEQVVRRLVYQQWHFQFSQQCGNLGGLAGRVGRNAHIQRLALAHDVGQGNGGFLQRGVGIEAVRIEDVDVIKAQALQALVQAADQVFARAAALPVRARPHVPTRLARDDQLVAVAAQVLTQQPAEIALGAAIGRAVIVG